MSNIKILLVVLLITSYNLARLYFIDYIDYRDAEFIIKTFFWVSIGIISGFFEPLITDITRSLRNQDMMARKKLIQTFLLWTLAVFLLKKIGWFQDGINESATILIAYIPIYWLFKIRITSLVVIPLSFLLLTGVYFLGQFISSATIFINSTYQWIALIMVLIINDIYSKEPQYER